MKINTSLLRLVGGTSLLAFVLVANAASPTKSASKTWNLVSKRGTAKGVAKMRTSKTTRTRSTGHALASTPKKRHSPRLMHQTSTHLLPVKTNAIQVKG